jgi:hypothetical protein
MASCHPWISVIKWKNNACTLALPMVWTVLPTSTTTMMTAKSHCSVQSSVHPTSHHPVALWMQRVGVQDQSIRYAQINWGFKNDVFLNEQVLTDRFACTEPCMKPCNNLRDYCGGTIQVRNMTLKLYYYYLKINNLHLKGLIRKLDYIEGMGFNAIWISPIPESTN